MRQDHKGCMRVMIEGGLGCLVVLLSLMALVLVGLRGGPEDGGPEGDRPTVGADLRERIEDAVRDARTQR